MPSSLSSYPEFAALLLSASARVARRCGETPDEQTILSIKSQLTALQTWTLKGRKPEQGEKDQLNFGLIASRFLDDDDELCHDLCELASYVIYWE